MHWFAPYYIRCKSLHPHHQDAYGPYESSRLWMMILQSSSLYVVIIMVIVFVIIILVLLFFLIAIFSSSLSLSPHYSYCYHCRYPYIKQFLYEIFVMSGIIKVEVKVISRSITLTKTLIILYIRNTESNKTAVTNMTKNRMLENKII